MQVSQLTFLKYQEVPRVGSCRMLNDMVHNRLGSLQVDGMINSVQILSVTLAVSLCCIVAGNICSS